MPRELTIEEKWEKSAREKDGGIGFREGPEGKHAEFEGFTDDQMRAILGEEDFKRYKAERERYDNIDEV